MRIWRFYSKEIHIESREDTSYMPSMSIIIPTYNEAMFIVGKLDEIHKQYYPRNRLEVIIVDSGLLNNNKTIILMLLLKLHKTYHESGA